VTKEEIQNLFSHFNSWFNSLYQRSFNKPFLTDAIGSTRNLTNSTGITVKSLNYDIFGAVRTQTGTSSTNFKYTGEQTDDESGLVFLRARYYDPYPTATPRSG